ncbi:hypothetical protein B5X24_HaOG200144 [Helicoverpa armigera]|nr:hypothetical protein B5X24_HaOG200144 [Helicoverpa armigera]
MKKKMYLCVCMVLLNHVFKDASSLFVGEAVTVELPQGKVKGSYDWSRTQRIFSGIPYASVTERFEEPGNPPSWHGTFNADRGNIKCNQYISSLKQPVGQEDCLVLNIFTPPTLEPEPFPVMVFIPGGGFYSGSNSELIYNPKFLVQRKVIVVTINYRVGAFGFLCLGLKEASGNMGLKDQLAALKWIQKNIAYFSGNPDSITLFGESAGAVSVHYLNLNPSAKGLFHRAIMQSGSIMMPQDFSYQPLQQASKVAKRLGYNTSDPSELLKIFKNSTANDIVRASFVDQNNNALGPYLFGPCVETAVPNGRPFITQQPGVLLKTTDLSVPVIIGFNNKEGINWASNYAPLTDPNKIRSYLIPVIPSYLEFGNPSDQATFVNDIIKKYFANNTDINGLIEYFTDALVAFPITLTSEHSSQKSDATVFNYYFKYDSIRNLNKFLTRLPTEPGASHGDDLLYMFQPAVFAALPSTRTVAKMIATITKLWTSFAKTGKPTISNTNWRPSKERLNFLEIDNKEVKMITLPNQDRMDFFKKAYEKFGRREGK